MLDSCGIRLHSLGTSAASGAFLSGYKETITVFIITNRIPVARGQETAFEDRFRNRSHLIDQAPGFIRNLVLRPVPRRFDHETGGFKETEEQGSYLIQTWWESEKAFWDWTQSESFRIAHSNRPPAEMFAGPSVLEIHQVVQSTDAREPAPRESPRT